MPGPSAADLAGSAAQGRAFEAIERLHLEQLVRTGELDEALAVLRSDLSTPWAHRRVVRFLEEQGRYREAFAAAEAAVKQHPADRFLEDDLLRCYERDGWTEEAFALRQQQFEREPTVERYQAVVAAGLAAARPGEAVRATLFEALVAQEQRAMGEEAARMVRPPFSRVAVVRRDENSEPARIGPDVSLRARILCSESRWLDAWAVVQPPSVCTDAVLQHIARHLPATHHPEAVRLLKQVFERVMPRSTSPYREALALVADIAARMPADQRAAWLMGLRVGFKAKRNFVRDLPCG